MKLTNRHNLPSAIVEAVKNDPYNPGDCDISVTKLIDSPMIRQLTIDHKEEVEQDVSDCTWSLLGQAVHAILERVPLSPGARREERLYTTINGKVVSGQFDWLEDGELSDYKVTSVWSVIFGKSSWENQLNVLAYLAHQNGIKVDRLSIVAILRDWQAMKVGEGNYPATSIVKIPIPLWSLEKQRQYIESRLKAHFEDEPTCSSEERWQKSASYAVLRDGRKSAIRVLSTEEEAGQYVVEHGLGNDPKVSIEKRPGEAKRCKECRVSKWCKVRETPVS